MKFISHGAAREVTGSCHELQVGGKRILLDCGLFQGHRREAAEKNAQFSFEPPSIDAVILSHAHMDHAGRIPLLFKRGYRGPVHCTYATQDLAAVMLKDGGYIQEKDEEFFRKRLRQSMIPSEGPLYTQQDALECMRIFKGHNYGEWFEVADGVRVQFLDAGHIIGAAMMVIEAVEGGKTTRIGFSGDLGRSSLPILRDPAAMPSLDVLICESTYGDRNHEDIIRAREQLQDVIIRTAKRGGKVLIPAFSLERTQEIVYDLHVLWDERKIPAVPIVIDSPLASHVTEVFMKHPECYDKDMFEKFLSKQHNPFQFSLVRYTESVEESKALNGTPGPMVIMAASGMCEAGRIRHHLRNEIEDPRNTVLAVGYMAENTLGRRITDPSVGEVKIFDQMYRKGAEVVFIDAYSAHAGKDDLDAYVASIPGLRTVILVHGEAGQMDAFAGRLRAHGVNPAVETPVREQEIGL
ncbi:MAG: MBL fold metallo-hydrolase [Candidatus Peribacteraceae bacterium]|nr:MBL fold metallo-hydrolase [Candidatus Peribacteraceae bacterium]